jgi:predicted nucleic acid-binding protein
MIVDSNVLIDIINPIDALSIKSANGFSAASGRFPLNVNIIILAEVAPGFDNPAIMAAQIEGLGITMVAISLAEAYRAGTAFRDYRRNGGPRTTILPDFLIGAQASVRGWPILTRDPARFASYFPEVELIDPLKVEND